VSRDDNNFICATGKQIICATFNKGFALPKQKLFELTHASGFASRQKYR
jgi:hypothetical protein